MSEEPSNRATGIDTSTRAILKTSFYLIRGCVNSLDARIGEIDDEHIEEVNIRIGKAIRQLNKAMRASGLTPRDKPAQ